jgi:hypothetical protein
MTSSRLLTNILFEPANIMSINTTPTRINSDATHTTKVTPVKPATPADTVTEPIASFNGKIRNLENFKEAAKLKQKSLQERGEPQPRDNTKKIRKPGDAGEALPRVKDDQRKKQDSPKERAFALMQAHSAARRETDTIKKSGDIKLGENNQNPEDMQDLRSLYKPPPNEKNKLFKQITPLGLIKSLIAQLGRKEFYKKFQSLRKALAANSGIDVSCGAEGRTVAAMSDKGAFDAVQSSLAFASELRGKLADHGITPEADQVETAMVLLGITESEGGNAEQVAGRIVHPDHLKDPAAAACIYRELGKTIEQLPTILWSQDRITQRSVMLEDCRLRSGQAGIEAHVIPKEEERLEQNLRAEINGEE